MKRTTAFIVAVITVLFVAVTASLFLVRAAEDRVTADLVARVDRFAIPADWKQLDDIVRPERFLCMSTNPCPSISRRWNAGKDLTLDELESVVSRVSFEMKTEGACQQRATDIGRTTVCDSTGTDGKYDYILNVTSPDVTNLVSSGSVSDRTSKAGAGVFSGFRVS
ncbi:hypothetical protein GU243_06730 [Pseudarthrobacter psychrotolerans]|uniref:Uncharacterized protein n=1 Tax=Pseudarthrobacter psychrotolerans TaxID=2697569 RepID=A0A6P1NIT5_9MICC|nr:hypothetical protein [Pseudarthrobacter psychrotolerans]QHK19489.1 hypothetical protein GU243_06730 [Pseudarthrobacter psychrotolerans]